MRELLFIEPVLKEAIWGGNRLKEVYNCDISSDHTGECQVIGAHRSGGCKMASSTYVGCMLSSPWKEQGELFSKAADSCEEFPLLVKIIDAGGGLSIRVHPDNTYAAEHENSFLGKMEYWCILDCDEDETTVIGHHAKDREEPAQVIGGGRWNELIRQVSVKKGDFFQIDPGCIHAIKGGTLTLEIQQSNGITYRVYDYDRLSNGRPRQLHVKQSVGVIRAPFVGNRDQQPVLTADTDDGKKYHLVTCAYYIVDKMEMTGHWEEDFGNSFANVNILEGEDTVDDTAVARGSRLIIPTGYGIVESKGRITFIPSQTVQKMVTKVGRQVVFLDKV